jgi:hypothetical protein
MFGHEGINGLEAPSLFEKDILDQHRRPGGT